MTIFRSSVLSCLIFVADTAKRKFPGSILWWRYPPVFVCPGRSSIFSSTDPATWIVTFYYLVIVSMLLVIFVYDSLFMEIPGLVLWPAIAVAVGFNLLMDSLRGGPLLSAFSVSSFPGY